MSVVCSIPYGRGSLPVEVPSEKLLGCFSPASVEPLANPALALRDALRDPCESPPLRAMAQGKRSAAVVIDDSTRAVPTAELLDALLPEMEAGGLEPGRVTVLIATGLHRRSTEEELRRALGGWHGRVRVENHDAEADGLAPLGRTSLGTEVRVNRTFAEAEFKVLTGDVEPHQICGYSGGAKSVYPGLANSEAIRANHSRMDLPGTGPGRLEDNPVRREIDEAGAMAGIDFLLTVVLNVEHKIVSVHAGDWRQAFRNACPEADRIYRVRLPERADLVIASAEGQPRDRTLYQSQKALRTAAEAVRPGGTIVLAAECAEGSGSGLFEQWMDEAFEPEEIVARIKKSFVMGGHKAYQIARELRHAEVCLYSAIAPGKVRSWFMRPLRDWAEVQQLIDGAGSVSVLPRAASIVAEVAAPAEKR